MRIVVGITGASGVVIGARLVGVLAGLPEVNVDVVVSEGAKEVFALEMSGVPPMDGAQHWHVNDMSAPIASSSRAPHAMVVAPCSIKTLAAVAHGYANDLIVRVADMMLRMNRPLVLMPRETPLSLPAIENMRLARLAGAVLLPPMVAYYPCPQSVDDVTDFFVGKALDVLGIEHHLYSRWKE